MTRSCRLAIALTFAVCLVLTPFPVHAEGAPSTGSRIGTIIKDAIEVALPNTTKLLEAIFPSRSDKDKADKDKADKATVKAAADAQAAASKQAAEGKLRDLSNVATELSVIGQYLERTVPASQKVSRMLAKLDGASNTPPPGLTKDWEAVNDDLKRLGDIKASELNTVDPGLRLRLIEVRGIYEANKSDIPTAIEKGDVSILKSQLRAFSTLLNSVVSIAGIEITSLQDALSAVTKSLGMTAMGGSPSARSTAFDQAAADDIRSARRVLIAPPSNVEAPRPPNE
jgi:hypothetical protein